MGTFKDTKTLLRTGTYQKLSYFNNGQEEHEEQSIIWRYLIDEKWLPTSQGVKHSSGLWNMVTFKGMLAIVGFQSFGVEWHCVPPILKVWFIDDLRLGSELDQNVREWWAYTCTFHKLPRCLECIPQEGGDRNLGGHGERKRRESTVSKWGCW